MSEQASGIVVGALVIRKEKLDSLPPDVRAALVDSARDNARRIEGAVRSFDERAYTALVERGIRPVDAERSRAEWEAVAARARAELAGRLFPQDLLDRVERIAAQHPR
jgi:TRAP-type C4-dicarboxylate transport system substrate-binding protein